MSPIKIRLYGLFSVTRQGYLMQLTLAAVLLLVLLIVRYNLPPLSELAEKTDLPRHVAWSVWLLRNLHWIVLAGAVVLAIEAFLVLRAFAREAAKRRPVE